MDLLELTTLDQTHLNHWYYRSKFNLLRPFLSQLNGTDSLIDIGSGSGIFSHLFLNETPIKQATAFDINYKENSQIQLENGKDLYFKNDMSNFSTNLILLMDILEHIDHDKRFLSNIVEHSDPGTTFFITVPAFQRLFSTHDIYLKHFRRYNKAQLKQVVIESGLEPIDVFYGFYTLFLPVAIQRIMKALCHKQGEAVKSSEMDTLPNAVINSALTLLHKHEPFLRNRFFGLSCVCIAKKV